MNRDDFIRLIGGQGEKAQYVLVACLLRSGYGCAGYYNAGLNADLKDTIVLLNARMAELTGDPHRRTRAVDDFNEFIEEVVVKLFEDESAVEERAKEQLTKA